MSLAGKNIVLGLTGGIACYKAAELARGLVKAGSSCQVVMTEAARHFITPVTMQALSGKPVFTDQWDSRISNNMAHIDLSRHADAILIAPCSADFIRKLVHGASDDLLSTLCLARPANVPLLVAPAMNVEMWDNPATQRNAMQLKKDGITLLGPAAGDQACGETGLGRMLEPEQILESLHAFFQPKLLAGKKVLITAGPTFEPIDPVRGITNLSSGKMGFAIARAAWAAEDAAADRFVVLIRGGKWTMRAKKRATIAWQGWRVGSSLAIGASSSACDAWSLSRWRCTPWKVHKRLRRNGLGVCSFISTYGLKRT